MGMSLSFFTLMTNDKDMFKPNTEIKQSEHNLGMWLAKIINSVDKVWQQKIPPQTTFHPFDTTK